MKVAMVTASLSRRGAGVSAVLAPLSRYVTSLGVEVRMFSLANLRKEDDEDWTGAPAVRSPTVGPRFLGYAPTMVDALIAWQPDVVHSHGIWLHPSRSVLQWSTATRRPYVVSPHGMLGPEALRFSPFKKRVSRWLFQDKAFARAAMLHATCDQEAEEIRAFGLSQKIAVIPNGIELPDSVPNLVSNVPFVLTLGRIHPKKGIDRLIRAWATLEPSAPDWHLKIVGPSENGHAEELARLVLELKLKRVEISGPVFGQEKTELLAGAELFALPTLNENFAMTVAESLSLGTPVISTKGAPWSGLETHGCGWWVDHGVEPIAAALRAAMSLSRQERSAMGMRGREWMANEFAWGGIARRLVETYRSLVDGSPAVTA